MLLASIVLVGGLLADLISHNRRLLEKKLDRLPRGMERGDDVINNDERFDSAEEPVATSTRVFVPPRTPTSLANKEPYSARPTVIFFKFHFVIDR